jgi:hypothetical protein
MYPHHINGAIGFHEDVAWRGQVQLSKASDDDFVPAVRRPAEQARELFQS